MILLSPLNAPADVPTPTIIEPEGPIAASPVFVNTLPVSDAVTLDVVDIEIDADVGAEAVVISI